MCFLLCSLLSLHDFLFEPRLDDDDTDDDDDDDGNGNYDNGNDGDDGDGDGCDGDDAFFHTKQIVVIVSICSGAKWSSSSFLQLQCSCHWVVLLPVFPYGAR